MELPNHKRFFRIGEVSRILGVRPYVLRYWEMEFPEVRPKRSDSKHRIYERQDIFNFTELKRLLYEEKLTIEGARKRVKESKKSKQNLQPPPDLIGEIKKELKEVLRLLE